MPLKNRAKGARRPAPDPVLEWLFHRMADESPGVLRAVSWTKGKVRLKHTVFVGPFGSGVRSECVVKDFTVVKSHDVTDKAGGPHDLVEVRVRGLPSVSVSPIPSAVLAVAFR